MKDANIVKALREHAEWAEGNQWETPITLCDDLAEASDLIWGEDCKFCYSCGAKMDGGADNG